ncbi:zinc finger BED domain-containing 4-like isoform X1, partial [Brachionus plicatilis]
MGTLLHLVGEDEFDLSDREIEEIRWNSELKCLRAICKIKLIDLNEALNMINNQGLNLSQNEHSRLAEIINILEPFEFVTNEIQGDQYSTLSLVVPSLLQLIQHLNDFKLVNNSLKAFISELRNEINTRFSVILDFKNNSIVDYS